MAKKTDKSGKNYKAPTKKMRPLKGSKPTPIDHMSLVIQGKGQYKTFKPVSCGPWQGTPGVFGSHDKKQAELNRAAGLLG